MIKARGLISTGCGTVFLLATISFAQQKQAALQPGDTFPQIAGQTPTGKILALPSASAKEPTAVVFSFSEEAKEDDRQWIEHLLRESIPVYMVVMLESVPKLFHGLATSIVKSNMPVSVQDRTIMAYQNELVWKKRLDVSDDSHSYVVLLSSDGHIRWNSSGSFTPSQLASLESTLEVKPTSATGSRK